MTTVVFHGLLKEDFGKKLKIKLGSIIDLKQVLLSIDSIKHGFRKRVLELSEENKFYCIKRIENELHIIPTIIGAGLEALIILAMVFALAGGLGAVGLIAMAAWLMWTLIIISVLLSAAANYVSQMKKIKKMIASIKFPDKSTGGTVGSSEAKASNKYFDNNNNNATQGSMVQIGYGRLKIGSRLIMASKKTFSTSVSFNEIVINNSKGEIF